MIGHVGRKQPENPLEPAGKPTRMSYTNPIFFPQSQQWPNVLLSARGLPTTPPLTVDGWSRPLVASSSTTTSKSLLLPPSAVTVVSLSPVYATFMLWYLGIEAD